MYPILRHSTRNTKRQRNFCRHLPTDPPSLAGRWGREGPCRETEREGSLASPAAQCVDSGRIDAHDPVAVRLRRALTARPLSLLRTTDRRIVIVAPARSMSRRCSRPPRRGVPRPRLPLEQDLEPIVGRVQDRRDPVGWVPPEYVRPPAWRGRVSGHVLRHEPPPAGLLQRGSNDRVLPTNSPARGRSCIE